MAKTGSTLATARQALGNPVDFDDFLTRLGAKDRQNIERHVAAATANDGAHLRVWRQIVCSLASLAGHAFQTVGQQAIQFFIQDGKYRKQVFALEDPRDGRLLIYVDDVLARAIDAGLLKAPRRGEDPTRFGIGREARQTLTIEQLDAANTPNPHPFYKHMLGWNRRALRITLSGGATPAEVSAAEAVCALAAQAWSAAAAAK